MHLPRRNRTERWKTRPGIYAKTLLISYSLLQQINKVMVDIKHNPLISKFLLCLTIIGGIFTYRCNESWKRILLLVFHIEFYYQNINDKASLSTRQTMWLNTELKILVTTGSIKSSKILRNSKHKETNSFPSLMTAIPWVPLSKPLWETFVLLLNKLMFNN